MGRLTENTRSMVFLLPLVILLGLLLAGCDAADTEEAAAASGEALIDEIEGTVEWLAGDVEQWAEVEPGARIEAGDAVRTDSDGQVWIVFPDNSRALLGPDTEIALAEVAVDAEAARRVIRMEQRRGETRHVVLASEAGGDGYAVSTPNEEAITDESVFAVSAEPGAAGRLAVSQGLVNVHSAGKSYPVAAGRTVSLQPGQPPEPAAFAVFGQGEVTYTGDIWVIGGRSFLVDENTVISGGVTEGGVVYVEGHMLEDGTVVADLISPSNDGPPLVDGTGEGQAFQDDAAEAEDEECLSYTGTVTTISGDLITLQDGSTIDLAEIEAVDGDIELYSVILVLMCADEDGGESTRIVVLESPDEDLVDEQQVTICHLPPGNPENAETITVGAPAVAAHLAHGDYVGACEDEDFDDDLDDEELDDDEDEDLDEGPKVTICHIPGGNAANAHTIRIDEADLQDHLDHGDYEGPCDGDELDGEFDEEGEALDDQGGRVTICHVPGGNPNNAHTIAVDESALQAHLAHGDYEGACEDVGPNNDGSPGNSGNRGHGNRGNNGRGNSGNPGRGNN